jgi:hypothetical protein
MVDSKSNKNVMLDTLTGDMFKQLIEQFTQDGHINTIPELMRLVSDIPEDMTLGEYIREHSADPEVVEEAVDRAVDEAFVDRRVTQEELDTFEV